MVLSATVTGRYYAVDHDHHQDRIELPFCDDFWLTTYALMLLKRSSWVMPMGW